MQIEPELLNVNNNIHLLIVEDSKLSREYTKQILEKYYKNIIVANNGKEGLEQFNIHRPDIVITDIRMPEMDGLTMLEEMQKIDSSFYSIVLSAHDEKDYLKESIIRGVTRFITKPVQVNELLKTIESIKRTILFKKQIENQNLLIENILNSLDIIVVISDGQELFALNQYGLNLVGYNSIEEFKKNHKCICEFFVNEPGFLKNDYSWLRELELLKEEERKAAIVDVRTKEKKIFYIKIKPFFDDSEKKLVLFYDITIQEQQKEELKKLATIDFLTGIYNRHHFHTILEFHLEKHLRYKDLHPFAILMMDLDHFKQINDQYGHLIGDEVLKEFANVIKNNIRKSDFFARWGGEEFILLVPEIDKEKVLLFGKKLLKLIENHFKNHSKLPPLTVSIGITMFQENDTMKSLVERADQSLYLAKERGRNRMEFL